MHKYINKVSPQDFHAAKIYRSYKIYKMNEQHLDRHEIHQFLIREQVNHLP